MEHGLDENELIRRNKYIDKLNLTLKNFKLLKGCEANIMPDDQWICRCDFDDKHLTLSS
jgi:histidinol phosphatase-like PHP family hydrolase